MRSYNHLQTMALSYQEICQGIRPWTALGNFMNHWYDYSKDKRDQLIAESIVLPESPSLYELRWAAFCTASVEWFCERYGVACPAWTANIDYCLRDPWFEGCSGNPKVLVGLIKTTPAMYTRRNVFCGDRSFKNKYELMEELRQYRLAHSSRAAQAAQSDAPTAPLQ